jgi:hypothetical protein
MATAWSFLTLEDGERQFAGNAGYPDVLGSYYVWDATVPNHGRVAERDLAVLRDGDHLLGMGWIDSIETWSDNKDRYRCPTCKKTGFKERATIKPRYRCPSCKGEFDVPTVEHLVGIRFFRANYTRTWRRFHPPLSISEIASAYLGRASQHAIRELSLTKVRAFTDSSKALGQNWWESG